MRIPILLALAAASPTHAAAGAQLVGPPAPRVTKPDVCEQAPADSEEIVVCGERNDDDDSPYRIPKELRNRGPIEDRQMSWGSRVRDLESVERYSSQTVGLAGPSQNSRQVDCEWRAARQQAQGRQPDCTRRMRRDEPTDWQRR